MPSRPSTSSAQRGASARWACFAHIATLVKRLKTSRPGALLLDGGDTWQGSATALWTKAQDMVDAALLLGVDLMTGHWEFTYGMQRVKQIVESDFKGRIEFIAQNIVTADFGDAVFTPWVMREINGVPVAIIGQAFPYSPVANPRYLMADWRFGIQEDSMQKTVDEARGKGAQLVVLLSHNGMDVDLKMASRVRGIDVILGGHTHDGVPLAVPVANAGGTTLVTNAGCNGKFVGVFDVEVQGGRMKQHRYRLLPVFSNALAPDAEMAAHIAKVRAPFAARLDEKLAVSDALLYRRGNFNGSWDQLICDALLQVQGADIAFSPGFRWGTSLLGGAAITREAMMSQLAITYPHTTISEMSGAAIKGILAATQAQGALRNIRNHLDTDATARITVVTHAQGVDFLMEGAKDASGGAFASQVSALAARGVKFEVCEITLKNRSLKKEQFIQEADFTPSGVVRITKLQLQGHAYLRP